MEQSLNLLEGGDPVSALTLAGAAVEILGKIAARKGATPRVEYLASYTASLYEWARKPTPPRKRLIALENRARNELKHQDDGRNVRVDIDFEHEAESMLLRCMFNHFEAFGCYPSSRHLRHWFEHLTL